MNFPEVINTSSFWTGLMTIVWVNIILSGDNAVVIALAARALPKEQQGKAVFWGAGAAVVLRVLLTWFATALLKLPYLRIIGGLLLFWIGINLLIPQDDDQDIHGHDNLYQAIRTILIADLVMSVDNVLAVAAAANGDILLLAIGLVLSIPLVVFGASMLMKLMQRLPIIITFGAAMIGWVAGAMLVTDPAIATSVADMLARLHDIGPVPLESETVGKVLGAAVVLVVGKAIAARACRSDAVS
jgi:YjbE family integral membrane protein